MARSVIHITMCVVGIPLCAEVHPGEPALFEVDARDQVWNLCDLLDLRRSPSRPFCLHCLYLLCDRFKVLSLKLRGVWGVAASDLWKSARVRRVTCPAPAAEIDGDKDTCGRSFVVGLPVRGHPRAYCSAACRARAFKARRRERVKR